MSPPRQTSKKTALLVRQQESDAPFLPVDELERLHRFRPDTIDWVLERTDQEIACADLK